MHNFLSDDAIALHREYIKTKKLRYSIFESTFPSMIGARARDILRMKISARDKRDAILLSTEIELHEVYFSSFCDTRFLHSPQIEAQFGSESAFLNEVYRFAISVSYGFVIICINSGRIDIRCVNSFSDVIFSEILLAIDVCEHAYFSDYGFGKERYLLSCLPYLNLGVLSKNNI